MNPDGDEGVQRWSALILCHRYRACQYLCGDVVWSFATSTSNQKCRVVVATISLASYAQSDGPKDIFNHEVYFPPVTTVKLLFQKLSDLLSVLYATSEDTNRSNIYSQNRDGSDPDISEQCNLRKHVNRQTEQKKNIYRRWCTEHWRKWLIDLFVIFILYIHTFLFYWSGINLCCLFWWFSYMFLP